jgi:hypothetical protein
MPHYPKSVWECVGLRIGVSLSLAVVGLALVACSDDTPIKSKNFETKGLVPPSAFCAANPARFGDAAKVSDIDQGNGCFVHNAYEVSSLVGVRFNQAVTFNCGVANVTAQWLDEVVQPAADDAFGEKIVGIDVPAGFACRPRNNVRGAKLSEHGMGNAIDISAFTLESGRKVSVEQGWFGDRDARGFLQKVRGEACGPFKTVLGPGADSHHKDHFHLDLQRHRSGGSYCR